MPVPFEALLPFGIMIGMFAIAGGGLAATKTLSNEGKTHRYNLDIWERQMMERDRRLTGTIRYSHLSDFLTIVDNPATSKLPIPSPQTQHGRLKPSRSRKFIESSLIYRLS